MIISGDGVIRINKDLSAPISIVKVSGSLGGGIAVLGYADDSGAFVPLTDGTLVIGGQYEVRHGAGESLLVKLTGSTGAVLIISVGAMG